MLTGGGLRRLIGLGLLAAACGESDSNPPATPDAGSPDAGSPPATLESAGRCDPPPRRLEATYCAGVPSEVLSQGDGDDVLLDSPNASLGEEYLFAFDDTCADGRWTIDACAEGGVAPCVWIDSLGKDWELCGEYHDRAGTIWTLTELTEGLPSSRTERSASGNPPYTDLVVNGELSATFENGSGESLELTLSLQLCGPIRTTCCLC